ncbi:D-alanyl-D-alanine carboxypeptidase [Streptomyces sp. NPDC057694]|uniref:D-alanyl-D-alanine carboxypeptidase n=1 Tax=Streptomyces sp. NPDC057694 TaxID=3346216 RepID=UPI0036A78B01
MAGTPDRSGEQQASGGPGSQERDPRLAVARETSPEVDRATAVFSVRDAAGTGSGSGSGSAAGTRSGPGASGTSGTETESAAGADAGADEPGDARLRAAVAAWVSGGGTSDSAGGSAGAGSEEAGPADADDVSEESAAVPDADAEDSAAEPAGADAGDSGAEDAAPETVAEAADAKDSGAEDADGKPADAEPVAPEAAAGSADAKGTGAEDSAAEPVDAEAAAPEAAAKGADAEDADAEPADAKPAGADAEAAEAEDSGAEDADPEPADPEPADPEPADAKPAGPEAAAKGADAEGSDAEDADAKPAAKDADAEDTGTKPAAPEADAKGASAKPVDAKDTAAEVAGAKGADAKDSGAKPADAKPAAVDQPTAVFKAVQPPVDQPTTMLKSPAAGGAGKAGAKEESEAERTSRFVPLKPLDESGPAAAKADGPAVAEPERTRQQPLPPKPPIDLLAELTNTPPPPETRTRTAVRRVKVWTPIVILLIVAFAIVQAVRPLPTPTLALTADDSYSFDGDSTKLPWPSEGQGWMDVQGIGTMDDFGKQTPVPIGSVAKSMTAYIILRDHPLKAGAGGPEISVDKTAEKEGGYDADGQNESTLNTVKEGDKLSEKDALSAVMIPSANNIARLLARWDAGSEEAFVKKMNATAKKLGMKNTTYTDPSGLKESTVSTAEDQVKLGNELVQIKALTDITKLPVWKDPSGKTWTNYNRLVPYDGAIGIKTGTTTKAGGNLLFAATKEVGGETVTVVGAILGQHKAPIIDTVNAVSKTAMIAAQGALKPATILKKGDVVGYVDDGLGGHTPVVLTKNVTAVGWAGKTVKLEIADQSGKTVPHTATAGTKVGVLKVGDGEGGAVEVPVALQSDLAEPGFGAKIKRVG